MKKLAVAAVAMTMTMTMTACGAGFRATQVAKLTGELTAGQTVFTSNCKSCHGSDGKGTRSGVDLWEPLQNDPQEEVVEVIFSGIPGTAMASHDSLSNQQVADLYAYMKATFK